MYQHTQITEFYNTDCFYRDDHLIVEIPIGIVDLWNEERLLFNKNYWLTGSSFDWEDIFVDFQFNFAVKDAVKINKDFEEVKPGKFVGNLSKEDPWYMKGKKFELVGPETKFFKDPKYNSHSGNWELVSVRKVGK